MAFSKTAYVKKEDYDKVQISFQFLCDFLFVAAILFVLGVSDLLETLLIAISLVVHIMLALVTLFRADPFLEVRSIIRSLICSFDFVYLFLSHPFRNPVMNWLSV